jgi:hypothetical protein
MMRHPGAMKALGWMRGWMPLKGAIVTSFAAGRSMR